MSPGIQEANSYWYHSMKLDASNFQNQYPKLYMLQDTDLKAQVQNRVLQALNVYCGASLVAQMVKGLPAMWVIWVQSLAWEDLLEKGMATHSSTLAWKIPWTEEPCKLQSMGSQRVGHD